MHRTLRPAFSFSLVLVLALVPTAPVLATPQSTTTVIEAPNQFGLRDSMPLRIQVTNDNGPDSPTGTVTLKDEDGRDLGVFRLQPTNRGGYSWAIVPWSTETLGLHKLRAIYNPGAQVFSPSSSTLAGIFIESSTPTVVLRMPDRFVVDTPANLTALVNQPTAGGSAVLQVNNFQVYNSTQVNFAGEVPFPWTPTRSTHYTFAINYTSSSGSHWGTVRQSVFATRK